MDSAVAVAAQNPRYLATDKEWDITIYRMTQIAVMRMSLYGPLCNNTLTFWRPKKLTSTLGSSVWPMKPVVITSLSVGGLSSEREPSSHCISMLPTHPQQHMFLRSVCIPQSYKTTYFLTKFRAKCDTLIKTLLSTGRGHGVSHKVMWC